jgi:hypothetical protein
MPPVIVWGLNNLTLNAGSNCTALMPDITGNSFLVATDACNCSLAVTQSVTTNTVLALGLHPVVLATADCAGNTSFCTNSVVVVGSNLPVIAAQPESETNYPGTVATFRIAVNSCSSPRYQWRFNGTPLTNSAHISGAASSELSITNVQFSDAGNYSVVVSNAFGFAVSLNALLTVTTNHIAPTTSLALAWGDGGSGQLDDGTTNNSSIPVAVSALPGRRRIISVDGGMRHSLALAHDGTLWAWGWNGLGQMGNGTLTNSNLPGFVTALPDGQKAVPIAAGDAHSLALADDGTVWAWGYGGYGQLGTFSNGSSIPVAETALPGAGKAVGIGAGIFHSLALADDGMLWVWGDGGTLGNGTLTNSSTPVAVIGLPTDKRVLAIGTGGWHSFALFGNTNLPPVARCKNITVAVGAGCSAAAFIKDCSYDPDAGDSITITQTPVGPYPVGQTAVTLTVTASYGATNSCTAVVSVNDIPPVVATQPQGQTNYLGTVATFKVAVNSCSLPSYQWRFNGMPLTNSAHIGGAASSELSITNVQFPDAGDYSVLVSSAAGAVASSNAFLLVLPLPQLTLRGSWPGYVRGEAGGWR